MKVSRKLKLAIVALVLLIGAISFFANKSSPVASKSGLTGAGSTFVIPLLDSCKSGYLASSGIRYTYSGGGSGSGRTAATNGIGDFNFSDTPIVSPTGGSSTLLQIPIVAAPIAVMYKLPISQPLNLSAATLAGIFGGEITHWNDPIISKENVGRTLPAKLIQVIFRADASGTSGNFTNFLHGAASAIWIKAGDNDFKASFPGNINSMANLGRIAGATGSSGVATLAGKTNYSITYAEIKYAQGAGLAVAKIKNAAGGYQSPDAAGTSIFLGGATSHPDGSLTFNYQNTAAGAYPLGIVSYALVDPHSKQAKSLKSFLNYLLDPQCTGANVSLGFSAISGPLRIQDLALISKLG